MDKSIKQKIREAVDEIYQSNGEVKPSVLVEKSKPKTSPTHDAFEWNNSKAGHEYRLIQARNYIRVVTVTVEDRQEKMIHVPIAIGTDAEGYYKPASVVVSCDDEYKAALGQTLARLNTAKDAYLKLKQAAERSKQRAIPDFKAADRGFEMIGGALSAG